MATFTTLVGFPITNDQDFGGEAGQVRRDVVIQYNNLTSSLQRMLAALATDSPLTNITLSVGTGVTLATAAGIIAIGGVPVSIAAQAAQALGALGTIPSNTWGIISVDAVAAGTITFVSGAANYTTGYTTEALAIAAVPAKTAAKARIGYFTVKTAVGLAWIAGTDALFGNVGGNPASATNYYTAAGPYDTLFWTNRQIGNMTGVLITV